MGAMKADFTVDGMTSENGIQINCGSNISGYNTWGGSITYGQGPFVLSAALDDSDGDVFFAFYLESDPSQQCILDLGSGVDGMYLNVMLQNGIAVAVTETGETDEVRSYTLTLTVTDENNCTWNGTTCAPV